MAQSKKAPSRKQNQEHGEAQKTARDHLIELLNSEIESIHSEHTRPGWTQWALYVALASLIWLMLGEVEKTTVDWNKVATLSLSMTFFFCGLASLLKLIQFPPAISNSSTRFYAPNMLARTRTFMLVAIIIAFSIGTAAYLVRANVFPLFVTIACAISAVLVLTLLLALVGIYRRLPIAILSPNNRISVVTLSLCTIGGFACAVGYCVPAFARTSMNNVVPNLRPAALVVSICYTLLIIVGATTPSPLLETLIALRRRLVLEMIEVDDARQQVDIVLSGLCASNVLQEDLREILGLADKANSELDTLYREVETLGTFYAELTDEVDKQQVQTIQTHLNSFAYHLRSYDELMGSFNKRLTRFNVKVSILTSSKDAKPEIVRALSKLSAAYNEMRRRRDEFVEKKKSVDQDAARILDLLEKRTDVAPNQPIE